MDKFQRGVKLLQEYMQEHPEKLMHANDHRAELQVMVWRKSHYNFPVLRNTRRRWWQIWR